MTVNQDIIDVLEGTKRIGSKNLTFTETLSEGDAYFNECHSFVQFLFPTPERSRFNPNAPILDEETAKVIKAKGLDNKILAAYARMLRFLDAAAATDGALQFNDPGLPLSVPRRHWCKPNDHNHLRLTRIIRCLKLLGHGDKAAALYRFLKGCYDKWAGNFASLETVNWWKKALETDSWQPMR